MVIDLGELKRDRAATPWSSASITPTSTPTRCSATAIPTTENIALVVWELLAPKLGADRLSRVRGVGGPDASTSTIVGVMSGRSSSRAVYHFSAAHRLANPALSDEENAALYGQCCRPHGHNYYLEVTVAGVPDAVDGHVRGPRAARPRGDRARCSTRSIIDLSRTCRRWPASSPPARAWPARSGGTLAPRAAAGRAPARGRARDREESVRVPGRGGGLMADEHDAAAAGRADC